MALNRHLIENEDEEDLSDFQKEMQAVDPAKTEEFLQQHFKYDDALQMWVIVSYSDFNGTIADRSNADYLLRHYPKMVSIDSSDNFNAATVGVHKDDLDNISADALYALSRDLETMENNGILDDEAYKKLQREKTSEAWLGWVWGRFITDLTFRFKYSPEIVQALRRLGKTSRASGLFAEAQQASGEEWVETNGGDMTIEIDNIVNSVTHEMLERWINAGGQPPLGESLMEAREFSCVMAPAPSEIEDAVFRFGQMFISDSELYDDPEDPGGFGRESEIHVTVKFGLHDAEPSEELLRIIEETQPFEIEIGPVTLFENEKFDVVKFDVDGEGLRELNRRISELPNGDSYPEYHPHMTVAYVVKGACNELIGKPLFDEQIEDQPRFLVKAVIFSSKNKTKTTLFLGKPNLNR